MYVLLVIVYCRNVFSTNLLLYIGPQIKYFLAKPMELCEGSSRDSFGGLIPFSVQDLFPHTHEDCFVALLIFRIPITSSMDCILASTPSIILLVQRRWKLHVFSKPLQ